MNSSSQNLFETARLGFKAWTRDDIDDFFELSSDPQVMRYFPKTLSRKEAGNTVDRLIQCYEDHGYTYYRVHLLSSVRFIGFIGIACQTYESPITPCTDIGWRLIPAAWGNGYATEGARVCLARAFEVHDLPQIYSMAVHSNHASFSVMKKIGMRENSTFDHPYLDGYPHLQPVHCYLMTAEDYASAS